MTPSRPTTTSPKSRRKDGGPLTDARRAELAAKASRDDEDPEDEPF